MNATNKRVADLVTDIDEKRLEPRPFFQRRLVWTNSDKEKFIDTVLRNYPFPEIFVAASTGDKKSLKRRMWLVDGQQRLTTLRSYVHGLEDLVCKTIRPFHALSESEQESFLQYTVVVRDLGNVDEDTIKEIFARINSTDYALKNMELLHAQFSGRFKSFCEDLSRDPFFETHKVFSSAVKKRMYDVTFCVILVTTMLAGYYRRDELNEEFLERYNDDFEMEPEVRASIDEVFAFVERCNFPEKSRAWKQTDLFTLLVELHVALRKNEGKLDPITVGADLASFFALVDQLSKNPRKTVQSDRVEDARRYLKAATKASNDKYARTERASVISDIISNCKKPPPAKKRRSSRS